MGEEQSLEDVKGLIKGILISSPKAMTVRDLIYDFRQSQGIDLPTFGFLAVKQFLLTIPDCVKLDGDYVYLVSSEKTAHIEHLVSKQVHKTSKKCSTPIRRNKFIKLPSSSSTSNSTSQQRLKVEIPCLSLGEKDRLKNYLAKKPNGVDFAVVRQLLLNNSMWSMYSLDKCKQLLLELCPFLYIKNNRWVSTCFHEERKIEGLIENCNNNNNTNNNVQCRTRLKMYLESRKSCLGSVSSSLKEEKESGESSSTSKTSASSACYNAGKTNGIPEVVKLKIKELISENNGAWCADLPELYYKRYKKVLNYQQYGCYSLFDMLCRMSDIVKCVRPGNGDWRVYDVVTWSDQSVNRQCVPQNYPTLPKYIYHNVLLCLSKTDGHCISSKNFFDIYYMFFRINLDLNEFGYNNIDEFFKALNNNTIKYEFVNGTSRIKLKYLDVIHLMFPTFNNDNDIFTSFFPNDVVGPGEDIKQLDLSGISEDDYIDVCISEVWSPQMFYVNIRHNRNEYNQMLDELQTYYTDGDQYKMCSRTARAGQVCAMQCNKDEWLRCKIQSTYKYDEEFVVYLVDHGACATVNIDQLRFLPRHLAVLPQQAVKACLAYVSCCNKAAGWSDNSKSRFYQLACKNDLVSRVVDSDNEYCWLSLELIDTLTEDLNIGQVLVDEGLALPELVQSVKTLTLQKIVTNEPFNMCKYNLLGPGFNAQLKQHLQNNRPIEPSALSKFQQFRAIRKLKFYDILCENAWLELDEVYIHLTNFNRRRNQFFNLKNNKLDELMKLISLSDDVTLASNSSLTDRSTSF